MEGFDFGEDSSDDDFQQLRAVEVTHQSAVTSNSEENADKTDVLMLDSELPLAGVILDSELPLADTALQPAVNQTNC